MTTLLCELEIDEEFNALFNSGKDSKFSLKRVFPKEKVKDGNVILFVVLPVAVGHGNLVQICKGERIINTAKQNWELTWEKVNDTDEFLRLALY